LITPESNNYRAIEHLRDGRQIEIRAALRPDDEADARETERPTTRIAAHLMTTSRFF